MKLTYHSETIRGYHKTSGFLQRQRERSIPDQLVRAVLRELENEKPKRSNYKVATSGTFMTQLKGRGLYHPQLGVTESLVVQVDGKKLVDVNYDRLMLKVFSEIWNKKPLHIL